ncbi:MAG: septal ring lytic transglycosylase RlpA family lipoprotein [Bacteroidetes bacterium QH_10_64_19]|nr:MAG: septal ring lytic transglycosylase RlpA family lipoprotein [Bacteroidetes bacterium QH_10_64_19]
MRIRLAPAWGTGLPRWAGLAFGLLLMACAATQHAGERGLPEEQGTASYYADKFVGRTTANGEIYDHKQLTAAHPSLPFGTRVRVTRIDHAGEPSVVVRINDRGPFKRGRIIDLSKAAARQLEMIREGIVEVRLGVISYPEEGEGSTEGEADTSGGGW